MKWIFFLSIFMSCSSAPKYESDTAPTWIADTDAVCGEKFLCAVGEGKSLAVSDARARSELAKIFQVEIATTLKSSESYQTGAALKENYFNEVTETSEKTLSNVKILEHWKKKGALEIFSLAGIDLKDAQSKVLDELSPLSAELKELTSSGKRSDLIQAKKLYPKMYPLIAQWRVLSKKEYQYSPKEADFVTYAKSRFRAPIEMSFSWSGNSAVKNILRGHLKDSLIENGYSFGRSAIKYQVKAKVMEEDLPIQLEGFIKKGFDLTIEVFRNNTLVGNIHHHFKTTGKNKGQLSEKARLTFLKVIYENLENLNIN